MLRVISAAAAATTAFAFAPLKRIGVQGLFLFSPAVPVIISTCTRPSPPFHLAPRVCCQGQRQTSTSLYAREGRGGRGGRGRGGRGRGGRKRSSRDRAQSTTAADGEGEGKEDQSKLSYRERWYKAHPDCKMNRQRRGNGRRGRGRRGPTPALPPPGQPGRQNYRDAITPGTKVYVVKKEDQRSGRETVGVVSRLLTKSAYHPRGIKVMLDDGIVGRVTRFDDGDDTVNTTQTDVNI